MHILKRVLLATGKTHRITNKKFLEEAKIISKLVSTVIHSLHHYAHHPTQFPSLQLSWKL
jgi:hypothetical protein